MSDTPKKLVPLRRLVLGLLLLFGWGGYRLYTGYEQAGSWKETKVAAVAITVCFVSVGLIGMFLYANRPEPEDKR
jgi:hypothetical protein